MQISSICHRKRSMVSAVRQWKDLKFYQSVAEDNHKLCPLFTDNEFHQSVAGKSHEFCKFHWSKAEKGCKCYELDVVKKWWIPTIKHWRKLQISLLYMEKNFDHHYPLSNDNEGENHEFHESWWHKWGMLVELLL